MLETACASADAFDAYESVDGRAYAVPRRENCGSYKPDAPTKESKCVCGDLGERKKFTFTAKHYKLWRGFVSPVVADYVAQ